jgi:hypothetical protein
MTYDEIEKAGFFCYASTGDGDLFRRRGLKGVRLAAWGAEVSVQVRNPNCPAGFGPKWPTVATITDAADLDAAISQATARNGGD